MNIQHYVFEPCTVEDVDGKKVELPCGSAFVSCVQGVETAVVGFQARFLEGQQQSITITQIELLRLIRSGLAKLK